MLPEPLRHDSGHEGSHTFITHEFIDALVHERRPAVDVYEAIAYTAPGIVAHQSALKNGERLAIPDFGKAPA
jgi:phage tail protein X